MTRSAVPSEHQQFGVPRGVDHHVGGPTGHLLHTQLNLRVGRQQTGGRFTRYFTRYTFGPVLVGLRAEQRSLGDGFRDRFPDVHHLQRQLAELRLAGRPFGGGPTLGRTVETYGDGAGHAVHLFTCSPPEPGSPDPGSSVWSWWLAVQGPHVPGRGRAGPWTRVRRGRGRHLVEDGRCRPLLRSAHVVRTRHRPIRRHATHWRVP
jgi:hypothetical protein